MLIFYTWAIRFVAETITLFTSVEQMSYLARYVPKDGLFFDRNELNGEAKSIEDPDRTVLPGKHVLHHNAASCCG